MEHADDLVSEEFVADVALERLIHTHTSGSTGTFFDVYWSKADMLHALLPLWVDRWKAAGIHARDRLCQFNTTLANDKVFEINGNTMIVSKDRLSPLYLEDTYRRIREFEPEWMILHPAMAFFLMERARKIRLEDGESIPADVLLKPVEMVNGYYQNVIYQFQAVQKSASQMELFIVMDEEFGREKFMQLYRNVIQGTVVGDMDFAFAFSDGIRPHSDTGKIKWFVNEME